MKKLSEKRLDICKTCENFDPIWFRCKKCYCFLKVKVRFSDSDCPLDKWKELK